MLVSAEQVSRWHPDKYADQISDAIFQACYEQDPNTRSAIETLVKGTTVVIAGELSTLADIEIDAIVESMAERYNYPVEKIIKLITLQSPEIANAMEDNAAGDQCTIVGYATNESPSKLPIAFHYANMIMREYEKLVESSKLFNGDAKVIVTVDTSHPNIIEEVQMSVCHKANFLLHDVRDYLENRFGQQFYCKKWVINPGGAWTMGGPLADCGLTGRKIVCDQYGFSVPVGGGAFSGKDFSKLDRSGAYAARILAKNLLKQTSEASDAQMLVKLTYMMGKKQPVTATADFITNSATFHDIVPELEHRSSLNVDAVMSLIKPDDIDLVKLSSGCHFYNTDIESLSECGGIK